MGDPGSVPATRATASSGLSCSATRRSGSTSMDQSRSVTLFHCVTYCLVVERDELTPVALVIPQEEPVRVRRG